ncbi:MAG TPA: ABC transporter ATP-binding protein [Candidatus Nanopelagicaceae bacterium]|nr:ABC transporter ATP-binding protein [Candidatus Nanopelagicaceae bacterium]
MKDKNSLPLIMVHDVDYVYSNGTIALKQVSLNIKKGEFIAIMGQNGAGKTTLIRTFNGLIRPTKGSIYLEGENIDSKTIATISKKVGVIFQNPMHQLFSNTLEDEIKFSLKSLNLDKEEIQIKVDQILKEFDLEKYRKRSPLNLSGGESKKLAIASIICRDPDILVFDEPTLGQDAKEINFFLGLIKNELKRGKTIIMVTHNIEFTIEHAPRIILMGGGQIIADGPTQSIFTNEFLISKSSLIMPQIYLFKKELQKIGITIPKEVIRESEIISFLDNYLESKSTI